MLMSRCSGCETTLDGGSMGDVENYLELNYTVELEQSSRWADDSAKMSFAEMGKFSRTQVADALEHHVPVEKKEKFSTLLGMRDEARRQLMILVEEASGVEPFGSVDGGMALGGYKSTATQSQSEIDLDYIISEQIRFIDRIDYTIVVLALGWKPQSKSGRKGVK